MCARHYILPGRRRKSKIPTLLVGLAVVVFLGGLLASVYVWRWDQRTSFTSLTSASTGPAPSTMQPTAMEVASYIVPKESPRYLSIPKLNINARVKSLGVNNSGQLEAPANVYDVGWYTGSSKPGQPGAMLVDGHVSSWTAHGVFYDLKTLHSGDVIKVERGDGTMFTYKVDKSQVFHADNVDMVATLQPINPNKPGLNLITCSGSVESNTSEFSERLVVFAEQE